MNKIGLGILFYNELENSKKILHEIKTSDLSNIDFYFFDNGSEDLEFVSFLSTIQETNIKVIRVEENLGFGGGAQYLLRVIPNEVRGFMPGNYKVRPKNLSNLHNIIADLETHEIFKATRAGRSKFENLKTFAVGISTSAYFGSKMFDSGGTPTFVTSDSVQYFQYGPTDFSYEAFVLFISRQLGFKVKRSKIPYGARIHGVSHWQTGIKSELMLLTRILEQKNEWKLRVKNTQIPKL